jgi:hypothetical protein
MKIPHPDTLNFKIYEVILMAGVLKLDLDCKADRIALYKRIMKAIKLAERKK